MECPGSLEKEACAYRSLLPYNHRHDLRHSTRCLGDFQYDTIGHHLALHVEQHRDGSLYVFESSPQRVSLSG